jgi:aspartate-semialdehyde dehydrogenase
MSLRVAVLGATGLVGRELLSLLEERRFPVAELTLFASEDSAGESVAFADDELSVRETPDAFPRFDLAFLCVPAEVARRVAQVLLAGGAVVVDVSPAHRDAPEAGLGVAGVVPAERRLVSIPDPLTVLLALVVRPLLAAFGPRAIRRVVATAIVSASAFGRDEVERLGGQSASLLGGREPDEDETPIAFDCVPVAGDDVRFFGAEVRRDLARLLEREIPLALTVVRAPVFHGQGLTITIELDAEADRIKAESALREAPSLLLAAAGTPSASIRTAAGDDTAHVGPIRAEGPLLTVWAASDNVRQAAALTAVSVAETLLRTRGGH